MCLNILFGTDHSGTAHNIGNPFQFTTFVLCQWMFGCFKVAVHGNSVLNHFVDCRVLLRKFRFGESHYRMGITVVVLIALGLIHQIDQEERKEADLTVQLFGRYILITGFECVFPDFVDFFRQTFIDEITYNGFDFQIAETGNLFVKPIDQGNHPVNKIFTALRQI